MFTPMGLLKQFRQEWENNVDSQFEGNPCFLIAHGKTRTMDPMKFKGKHHEPLFISDGEVPTGGHKFVVLTTVQSYEGQVLKVSVPLVKNPAHDNILWGCVFRDESHIDINITNTQFRIIKKLNRGLEEYSAPWIFFMTGTPLTMMLKAFRSWVLTLRDLVAETNNWNQHGVLKFVDDRWFESVETSFLKLKKLEFGSEEYKIAASELAQMTNPFLKTVMIRHSASTKINGQLLVELPPQEFRDIHCPILQGQERGLDLNEESMKKSLRARYQKRLERWKKAGSDPQKKPPMLSLKEILDASKNQRILTNVPGLRALQQDVGLALTWREIKYMGWSKNPKASPYYTAIDTLCQSSSKLGKLQEIQAKLATEKHGVDGQQEGLVIMAENPVMVFIIQCVSDLLRCRLSSSYS